MTMEEFYRGCDLLEKDGYCIGCYRYDSCASYYEKKTGEKVEDGYNPIPFSPWHTGTPTEKGLYVVLTKVSTEGVSSSEGTYILDYWDGYSFQYLKRKAMTYALTEPDTYGWVAWMPITPYEEKENGHTN